MNKKIIVVMPAYNAEKTLKKTYRDMPKELISTVVVVDDKSSDNTVAIARKLKLIVVTHEINKGYGGNQKTCYREALKLGADIVVMIHPDYQYDSSLTGELVRPIEQGRFDVMFGSRIRTRKEALEGGMPYTKYIINRFTTLIENFILGVNFTEHFSGFRAYSRKVLTTLPFEFFSNDFVFDQQLMISAVAYGFKISEYPIPVRYFLEASSIKFFAGAKFLINTGLTLILFMLFKLNIYKSKLFKFRK
jgi:glycosyltransferase involved in cell wall biosynthesis